jgi:uncharacterized protein YegJ (DUF2314 family)
MNKGYILIELFVLVVLMISCGSNDNPAIVSVSDTDHEMNAAMEKARSTLNEFIQRVARPSPSDQWFLVKGRFTHGGEIEHIWVADIVFDGKAFLGVLANEPKLSGLKFKQRVIVPLDNVSDWMYVSNGKLVGGYTTRVLYRRMSPEEREHDDAQRPYRID